MWPAPVLLLFLAGYSKCIQQPTLTAQNQQSYWPEESSYTANNAAEWQHPVSASPLLGTAVDETWQGAVIPGGKTSFEQPMPTKQDEWRSSRWPKETFTTASYPREWLIPVSSNPGQTAAGDVKPYGGSQEATTQSPYSEQRLSSSTEGFEQPLPTNQVKEQFSWWSKETTSNPLRLGEWLNQASSNPSQTASNKEDLYDSTHETNAQKPYSEQFTINASRSFEQKAPTKELSTTPPYTEEWSSPYSISQEAQRPSSHLLSGGSSRSLEQPQFKEQSPWWQKETTTNVPYPWEWLNSTPSTPHLTHANDVKPPGDSQEETTQKPYYDQGLKSSSKDFEQSIPATTNKEKSSIWPKETSINAPYSEWILPVPLTPKQTDGDSTTHLPDKDLGHTFDHSITPSLPTTISKNVKPNNPSQIKIKATKAPQGKLKSEINHHDIGGTWAPTLSTSQWFPITPPNIIDTTKLIPKIEEFDSNTPTSISTTLPLYNSKIIGSEFSPKLGNSQSLSTSTSSKIEPHEIKAKSPKSGNEELTLIPFTKSYENHDSNASRTHPQKYGSPPLKTNIEQPETMNKAIELDSKAPTDTPSTGLHDNPSSIKSNIRPPIKGSGRSPALGTPQPLPSTESKNIEIPEIISSTSQLVREEPISIPSKDSHDKPKIPENSTPPQVRGSGRSPLSSMSHAVPMAKSQQDRPTYPTEKEIETSKHDENAPILSTSPAVSKPNKVPSQVRGSGRSPIVSPTTRPFPNGLSSSNMSSTDSFHHGMTKETSMFMPLAPIGNTHSEGALHFPIEHVVIENVNDYDEKYFNSLTDQKHINNNDILVNSEPKQVKIEQQELNSNEQNDMNKQDIPELNLVNDYHSDEGRYNHHIPNIHHHHHHHTARSNHHTGHRHHGVKHQHAASQGHAKKHHDATAESHDVEEEHNFASPIVSENNDDPTNTRIESFNSIHDMPEIAYFLYHPSNFLA